MPMSAHVSTVSGQRLPVAEGSRLVFGRGPGVDLVIAAGRGLSRRAGVVTAAVDERLNDRGYIVPGLGDAGDRLFGQI